MTTVRISGVEDFEALGIRWRDLEQRSTGSFFQSWTWTGCLAKERFSDPVLVEATQGGRTVALALFNRVRHWIGPPTLCLGESGNAELDCPYIEQNGVLAEKGQEATLTKLCLQAAATGHDLVLSGVGEEVVAVVRQMAATVLVTRSQASPFVDLAGLRLSGADYLAGRSANTRQQVRRSNRLYERLGPISMQRANTIPLAWGALDRMAALHQSAWVARGQPGSFARPLFRRFHRALIESAILREEISILTVSCHEAIIGILYNFTYRGRMLAYQSGFAFQPNEPQAKPGLTCHCLAIQAALGQQIDFYEFLAGEDRYKRSLASGSHQQIWAQSGGFWSPRLLVRRSLRLARGTK